MCVHGLRATRATPSTHPVVMLISLSCLVDSDVILECVVKELHPPLHCPNMTLSALRDTCGVSVHKKVNKDIKK